jgi:hypothetical protein
MLLLIFGTPHKQKIKKNDEKIQKTNQKILEENKKDISVRRVY